MTWRVVVDGDRCEANAICTGIAPTVFELRDDTDVVQVLVAEPDDELRARVEQAVIACPRQAITIVGH